MSFSRSRASTSTSSSTTNLSRNLNIQDVEGITLGEAGGNVSITQIDQGAIAAGEAIARESLLASSRSQADAGRLIADLGGAAFNFADRSSDRQSETFSDALALTDRVAENQSEFARDIFGSSLETVTGVLREGQAQLGNTVTNLNAIARQQSTSTDERVQETARTALIALAAVVAVIGLAFVARSAR